MTESLQILLLRDLDKLALELSLYRAEKNLWRTDGEITNSAGNLALHLAGNLQHFIGALLGSSGYVRDRNREFAAKDLSRETLIEEIEATKNVIANTLPTLTDEQLMGEFPGKIPFETNVEGFLIHLHGHLNYHLGQINYHRRLLDRD